MAKISFSHPRYESLKQREKIIEGLKKGYVAESGLIAQGRGEAFDYLLEEKTIPEGEKAERVAVALLLLAKHPVISVNGNVVALIPKEIVDFSKLTGAKLEINLFYKNERRVKLIEKILKKHGAKEVLGVKEKNLKKIPQLDSKRGEVDKEGIFKSDLVLVSLEDGDRTEFLRKLGKTVIAIDLNPLSRTAQKATIAIVDNVMRAIPEMTKIAGELKSKDRSELERIIREFDNKDNLKKIIRKIKTAI